MFAADEKLFFCCNRLEEMAKMDEIIKNQDATTDIASFFDVISCSGRIKGRTFHPFASACIKGAVLKPDGGLRGYTWFLEFEKSDEDAKKEIEKKREENGKKLSREEKNDIRAANGIKIFLVHVLETFPKKRKTDVNFPAVQPSLDPDTFILLAESTPENPWTFTSVFRPDILFREYWKETIWRMGDEGAENVTEVDEDTMTFEWRMGEYFGYSLAATVDSITIPGQKRKCESDSTDTVKKIASE